MGGIFHSQDARGLLAGLTIKFIIFIYFDHIVYTGKHRFSIKMCTIRFFVELDSFQIDDKDPSTSNI